MPVDIRHNAKIFREKFAAVGGPQTWPHPSKLDRSALRTALARRIFRMRTSVTGAGGFLGRYVVEQLLARGDRVRAMRRASPELEARGRGGRPRATSAMSTAVGRACTAIDVVFHVAGVAGIWGPWRHTILSIRSAHGTSSAGCRRCGVGRLVYTSSPSVTFDGGAQRGVDEAGPYAQNGSAIIRTPKPWPKQEVLAANGPELATCALRPHLIWGPRDQHLVPAAARSCAGRLRRRGRRHNRIDMIYVENAAGRPFARCRRLRRRAPGPGLLHQSGRTGELLGLDQRFSHSPGCRRSGKRSQLSRPGGWVHACRGGLRCTAPAASRR